MRLLLSLFPISRREADNAAKVLASIGGKTIVKSLLLCTLILITLPAILTVIATPELWI